MCEHFHNAYRSTYVDDHALSIEVLLKKLVDISFYFDL